METFDQLRALVARLRAPDGCPWDREQTNASLIPALLEEAYEVAGAISAGDDANLREELGDLLLVILMHAQIASERNAFRLEDVVAAINAKLIRRHPHVFGDDTAEGSDAVLKQWEAIKRTEKQGNFLATLPLALPALLRAQKAQKKAARVNFDWQDVREVIAKVDEELAETKEAIQSGQKERIADEIGDLLFAVTNLARKLNLDAESSLRDATNKFVARFNEMEERLRRRGGTLGQAKLEQLDKIWNEIRSERRAAAVASTQ